MKPRPIYLPVVLLTLSVMLSQVSGCATMKLPNFKKERYAKADANNPVTQIICIWQPAEGQGLDELPSRGFAGQIVFLTANSPTPVEVDGDVTIYLFDDQGTPEERSKPLHVFRFIDGSWQTYLAPTAWGPTHQLFIPYVRKGYHRASCSLTVQLETPDGHRVTSAMANIVLPGSGSPSEVVSARFQPEHIRLPAGQIIANDMGRVVPASAQSLSPVETSRSNHSSPQFESFSIPYDFHRANAR